MKIILSSHLDRVIQNYDLSYRNGTHKGLLDNFIGVLVTYLAMYDDESMSYLEKKGKLKIWHCKGEEFGIFKNSPKTKKGDIVIVVDVACRENKDFYLTNVQGFDTQKLNDIRYNLQWEGYNFGFKKFDGNIDDEDETWNWKDRGIATISFEIPIVAKNNGWHRIQQDNSIKYEKVKRAAQGLKRLVSIIFQELDEPI